MSEIEELTYILSHDLQASLRHAKMFSSFLAEECQSAGDLQYIPQIEKITTSIGKLSSQLDSLLAYSKIRRDTLQIASVNLSDVIAEILSEMAPLIKETHANICCSQLPMIQADPKWIKLLFTHILRNAILFRKHGECASVRVCAEKSLENITVHIQDNGIGIDPKFHSKIFKFFQCLNAEKTNSVRGTGLPICKKIAEVHGGSLTVESSLGSGAKFTVTLPQPPAERKKQSTDDGEV